MNIQGRLLLLFGVVVVMAAIGAGIAFQTFSDIDEDIAQMRLSSTEEIRQAKVMSDVVLLLEATVQREIGFPPLPQSDDVSAMAGGASVFQGKLNELVTGFRTAHSEMVRVAKVGLALARKDGNATEVKEEEEEIESLRNVGATFDQVAGWLDELTGLSLTNRPAARALCRDKLVPALGGLEARLRQHHERSNEESRRESDQVAADTRRARLLVTLSIGLVVVSALLMALYATRTIAHPLRVLEQAVEGISHGRWAPLVTAPRSDELGRLAGAFNRMTAALSATTVSRDHVDGIIRSLADGLVVVKADGRIDFANDAAARLAGIEWSDIKGRGLTDLLRDGPNLSVRDLLTQLQKSGGIRNQELQCVHREGRMVPVLISASALVDSLGDRRRFVCTLRDISERKAAEAELARVNQELVDTSRKAGMAEIATGVLHNVGNVLNSLNVATTIVSDRLARSRLASLRKVTAMLEEHRHDLGSFFAADPKGQALPRFLEGLTEQLERENEGLREEVASVIHHVDHIKQIVSTQQRYGRVVGLIEKLDPRVIIEDALRLNAESYSRHQIIVERDFVGAASIGADRHKVLQILINLLRNAKQAVVDGNPADRRITIRLAELSPGRVAITVADQGVGISPENKVRIFQHGFTTKRDGHGFGLHASILAAREMKGDLTVESDGLGEGAAFTLELPVDTEPAAQAA